MKKLIFNTVVFLFCYLCYCLCCFLLLFICRFIMKRTENSSPKTQSKCENLSLIFFPIFFLPYFHNNFSFKNFSFKNFSLKNIFHQKISNNSWKCLLDFIRISETYQELGKLLQKHYTLDVWQGFKYVLQYDRFKSSHRRCSIKKVFLKIW